MAVTPHMIIFPFMAQGHTPPPPPLIDLAKMLAYLGVKITIFTTPANSRSILHTLSQTPNIGVEVLDFPRPQDLPLHCENTDQLPSMDFFVPFVLATKRLRQPFDLSLQKMIDVAPPPLCIISDFFFPWTLDSASKFNIPRLVFHGLSAYAISVSKSIVSNRPHKNVSSDSEAFEVPGLPTKVVLTKPQVPTPLRNAPEETNPFAELIAECAQAELRSHGAILNTFLELEPLYVSHVLSRYYRRVWCLGPVSLFKEVAEGRRGAVSPQVWNTCTGWLDAHADRPGSVIDASLGTHTQAPASNSQLTEMAWGLEASGCPFVLVVRSESKGWEAGLPGGRGLVLKEWAPQSMLLRHPAVGGFLTHCGWNSVMESLSAGVPMLTWPMMAEQAVNEEMLVTELGAGIRTVAPTERGGLGVVGRETVRTRVLELMLGEEGRRARARAHEIGNAARRAVGEGGSSRATLRSLVDHLLGL